MRDYHRNKFHRCKINCCKTLVVNEKSTFRLFNIFISYIFLLLQESDLTNIANDSTMYTSDKSISSIVNSLNNQFSVLVLQ